MDKFDEKTRSKMMANIKTKGTALELKVRKFLFKQGLRYRLNVTSLPGKPDIIFKKNNIAIFINGCFWHQHMGCKKSTIPKTNTLFWEKKLNKNKIRDKQNYQSLTELGWRVIIIWECEIKDHDKFYEKMNYIIEGMAKK